MSAIALKKELRPPAGLVYLLFLSVFLHYVVTGAVILAAGLYLLISGNRRLVFRQRGALSIVMFSLFTAVVGAVYGNWLGVVCSAGIFLILVIGLYARAVMTRLIFERALNLICFSSVFINLFAVVEKLLHLNQPKGVVYRCSVYFLNPNYLASLLAAVVIICAYKITTKQGSKALFYSIAAFCAVGLYLAGSMFALVEIFVGVAILLFLLHKHQMLGIFLMVTAIFFIILSSAPDLIPRLLETDATLKNRFDIWRASFDEIPSSFLCGHGFLSYFFLFGGKPGYYPTQHTHNIMIEGLLSFGIIGSVMILYYFIQYFVVLGRCRKAQHISKISTLILAVAAAVAVHSLTDLTFLWIQTGLLYALLLGGVAVEERRLQTRPDESALRYYFHKNSS